MADSTLLALAGAGLALFFLSKGSATVARVNNKLNSLAAIYDQDFKAGFNEAWKPEKNAQVSFCMHGMLKLAQEIQQKQGAFREMTKRNLMDLVRIDIGDDDNGALYFVRKLRNWAKRFDDHKEAFYDGPLEIQPRMVPRVKEFVDKSILIVEEALQLISEIFQLLPDESQHSALALVQTPSDKLKRLKFAL